MITSTFNPVIKQARALRQRKARAETGLFLVEGIHHVGEAVEAGWKIESILYAPERLTSDYGRALISNGSKRGLPLQPVSTKVMEALAGKENPQGLLANVRQQWMKLDDLTSLQSGAALVSPQDPGNVGTILRTLDAVGGDALFLLDGGVDPYHPTSVRASMGAIFWKPIVRTTFDEFVEWASQHGSHIVGTSAHASIGYRSFVPKHPFILLLGSEQKGLSEAQINSCHAAVSLPMRGRASSLNLAVAAGILLYQFMEKSS